MKVVEKKPYWDRRIAVAHRKINRKKYYGVGVEIENYVDSILDSVDLDPAMQVLEGAAKEDFITQEDFLDQIATLVSVKNLDNQSGLYAQISGIFSDSFRKGTRRLFTKKGNRVDVQQFVDDTAVSNLMNKQSKFFNNLNQEVEQVTRKTLRKGYAEGKGMDKIARDLDQNVSNFTRNRANTIARSEIIKASAEGTEATMKREGIETFMWLSARDERVCRPGNFEHTFNGKKFTSCREYDGTHWNINGYYPKPVKHSHPNCRCTLVADVD